MKGEGSEPGSICSNHGVKMQGRILKRSMALGSNRQCHFENLRIGYSQIEIYCSQRPLYFEYFGRWPLRKTVFFLMQRRLRPVLLLVDSL